MDLARSLRGTQVGWRARQIAGRLARRRADFAFAIRDALDMVMIEQRKEQHKRAAQLSLIKIFSCKQQAKLSHLLSRPLVVLRAGACRLVRRCAYLRSVGALVSVAV